MHRRVCQVPRNIYRAIQSRMIRTKSLSAASSHRPESSENVARLQPIESFCNLNFIRGEGGEREILKEAANFNVNNQLQDAK